MRQLSLLKFVMGALVIWACSGGGDGGSPTEPSLELPTVQNIEFTLEEDTSKTFAFMGADPLNRALTYSVSTQPQHGTLTINAGAGTYTPNANYHGADTFAYIATNVDGTSNIGTIVATITPLDDEPNSMDVTATTDEDNAIEITLQAEEYDGDNIEFQVRNNPSNGSVTISGTTATYTPNQDWNGTDTFNFEAVDSSARSVLNVATATITVNPVNDAPTVYDVDNISVVKEQTVEISLNADDIENDSLTFSVVDGPSNGTIESISGNLIYYKAGSAAGNDSFTFQANDGTDSGNVSTVDISIDYLSLVIATSNKTRAESIEDISNNQFAVLVSEQNGAPRQSKIYLINNSLEILNETTIDGNVIEYFDGQSIEQTSDGGFILGGYTSVKSPVPMVIAKTDAQGSYLWSREHFNIEEGNNVESFGYHVTQTSDGGFISIGNTAILQGTRRAIYIVKTDADGNKEWSNTNWEYDLYDRGFEVYETLEGDFIIGGHTSSSETGQYHMQLVKFDNQGNKIFSQDFQKQSGYGHSMKITNDNGYIIAGTGVTGSGNGETALVRKTDSSGNEQWSVEISSYVEQKFYFIEQLSTGDFLAVGSVVQNQNNNHSDILITKISSAGSILWTKAIRAYGNNDTDDEVAYGLKETSDGKCIIVGALNGSSSQWHALLIEIDSEGN